MIIKLIIINVAFSYKSGNSFKYLINFLLKTTT